MSNADVPLRGDSRPVRSQSVAWQTVDGETVILRHKEKELLGLNEVGGRIWELSDGASSIDQMVAAITAAYRVSAEAARGDVQVFVRELLSLGALDLRAD
jgi:Coenzyme PQQ synthesis protein D (PqqD)